MRIEVYRRITLRGWRWYWTAIHSNSNKMADSAEGYNSRANCLDSLTTVRREFGEARIYIMTDTGGIDMMWEPPEASSVTPTLSSQKPAKPTKPRRGKPKNRKRRD